MLKEESFLKVFNSEQEIVDYFDGVLVQNVVAVSKTFAKVLPKWSQVEVKLFFSIIERINWRKSNNGNVVVLSNIDLRKRIGWTESDNLRQFSKYVFATLKHMKSVGDIEIKNLSYENDSIYIQGSLFYHVEGNQDYTLIVLNPKFMPLFENLIKTKNYFTYWVSDIYKLRSKHAQNFYFELIEKSKKFGADIEEVDFTTKQLKNVFGLDKDSYMDKDGFNRSKFEKRTLDKAIEEIINSKLIDLVPYEDGKYYVKTKNGKKVDKYKFQYRVKAEVLKAVDGAYWYDNEAFARQKDLNDKARKALEEKGEKIYMTPLMGEDFRSIDFS